MKAEIKKIELKDWRAQNKVITFFHNNTIKGDNRQGKSSVFNAFLWLLTGVDEYDRANYNLFDNKSEQTYENSVPASVEGVFEIDGNEYTFKRVAKQGWTRPRNKTEYERKGSDDYSFFIDGIEVSATKYKTTIEELFAPIDKLKIMLNIRSFLAMDWRDMRKQLEAMVGEINDGDFKGDYSLIEKDLEKHTTDELKTLYSSQKREMSKVTDSLPISIEALKQNLPDIDGIEAVQKEVEECKKEYEALIEEMNGAKDSIQPYIDKRNAELKEIAGLEEEYKKAEMKHNVDYIDEMARANAELQKLTSESKRIEQENAENERRMEAIRFNIVNCENRIALFQESRKRLLAENKEVKEMTFTAENKCPYCGQELPEDKIEEQRAKFNERKEAKHKAIVSEGKANNESIKSLGEEIARLKEKLASIPPARVIENDDELNAKIASLRPKFTEYKETPEGKEKLAKIESKRASLTTIPTIDDTEQKERRNEIIKRKEEALKKLALKDEYDRQMKRIAELQEQLKTNTAEMVRVEGKIAKVKEYEQERADIVNFKVSSKFDYISIKMSEQNKSGEFVPACIITDNEGVNAMVTNNASRILCGIDISLAFQRHFNLQLPLFIDNFESVNANTLPGMGNQVVKLVFDYCKFQVGYGE